MSFSELHTSAALLLIGFGVLASFVVLVARNRKQLRSERQLLGLRWLSSLRVVLTHIQQHRGLTNGYLNGNFHSAVDIDQLQNKVSRNFAEMTAIDNSIEDNELWGGITQHWARLAGKYKKIERENNLHQHNQLIKNVLYLIDDLAQSCDLLLLKNRQNKPLHLYWRELLAAAEYIGQARAIGTGVAAAGHCDRISRGRLNYLCRQIEEHTRLLWLEIGSSDSAPEEISRLIVCINNQVLCEAPTIKPDDYFILATSAIDSLLDQFDQLIKEQQWQ